MAYVDYNSQTALEGAPEGRRRRRRPARDSGGHVTCI